MDAVVIDDVGSVSVRDVDPAEPADNEVVVRPLAVGICRTDHEIIEGHHPVSSRFDGDFELVPGHEWVGEVLETGASCSRIEPGDRVVGETSLYCNECQSCDDGLVNLCENGEEVGITRDGALAERLVVPERILHRVPDRISAEKATFIEPTAVAVHALDRATRTAGTKGDVVIYGDGNIGLLLTAAVAELWEPDTLTVVGRVPGKLDIAKSLGADITVDTTDSDDAAALVGDRLSAADAGADVVFEAVGEPDVVNETVRVADKRATVVFLGLERVSPVDMQEIVFKELSVHGSLSSPGVWPRAIDLVEHIPTELLRTDVVDLRTVPDVLTDEFDASEPDVKTVVDLS